MAWVVTEGVLDVVLQRCAPPFMYRMKYSQQTRYSNTAIQRRREKQPLYLHPCRSRVWVGHTDTILERGNLRRDLADLDGRGISGDSGGRVTTLPRVRHGIQLWPSRTSKRACCNWLDQITYFSDSKVVLVSLWLSRREMAQEEAASIFSHPHAHRIPASIKNQKKNYEWPITARMNLTAICDWKLGLTIWIVSSEMKTWKGNNTFLGIFSKTYILRCGACL